MLYSVCFSKIEIILCHIVFLVSVAADLRMAVRSSLYKKDTGGHEHDYGPESYDSDEDTYSKTCQTCNHTVSYEKM